MGGSPMYASLLTNKDSKTASYGAKYSPDDSIDIRIIHYLLLVKREKYLEEYYKNGLAVTRVQKYL